MRNSRLNKMRACAGTLVLAAALTMAAGCGKIEVISETVTIELGEQLSADPADYVVAEKEDQYADVVIDTSGVDTGTVGTYEAVVTYKDTEYTVRIEVVDTTAPAVDPAELLEVQTGTEVKAEDILGTVTDLAEVECMITGVERIGDLDTFEEGMTASAEEIPQDQDLTEISGLIEEEGIYAVTAYAVDASGNRTAAATLVVSDATAPELEAESYEITVDASEVTTEETDIEAVLDSLHELWNLDCITATDNYKLAEDGISYEVTSKEADVSGTDLVEQAILLCNLKDAVGNEKQQEVNLTVTYEGLSAKTIGKQTGLLTESSSSGRTSSGNSSSGSSTGQLSNSDTWIMYDENGNATEIEVVYGSVCEAQSRDDIAQELFGLINQARVDAGLSPLTWDSTMATVANVRAIEIDTTYSHTRPDGTTVSSTYGYGENISSGGWSASDVHQAFMNSEGHRANILREGITKGAVGVYQNEYGGLKFVELFSY